MFASLTRHLNNSPGGAVLVGVCAGGILVLGEGDGAEGNGEICAGVGTFTCSSEGAAGVLQPPNKSSAEKIHRKNVRFIGVPPLQKKGALRM